MAGSRGTEVAQACLEDGQTVALHGTGPGPNGSVIDVGECVATIRPATSGWSASVSRSAGERITLRGDGIECAMRCIEGQYPKVQKICDHLENAGARQTNLPHRPARRTSTKHASACEWCRRDIAIPWS